MAIRDNLVPLACEDFDNLIGDVLKGRLHDNGNIIEVGTGTPQGGVISP